MRRTIRQITHWSLLALSLLLIAACTGHREAIQEKALANPPAQPAAAEETPGTRALEVARRMLGVAYRYGGAGPEGFDCSGLVQYSFRQIGIKLPRTSKEIFRQSLLISPEKLQPGDLVFFTISSDKVSHVGIYAEQGRFIHAPSSGKGVSYATLDSPYWRQRLVAAGRF